MKRKLLALMCAGVMAISLTGCGEQAQVDYLNRQIAELSAQKVELENSIATLQEMETAEKVRTGTEVYVLEINIRQSHFTLDLEEHMKDAMNDVTISVPVSEDFYNSVEIGTMLDDSFRWGSFIFKGSLGSWKVKVTNKYIQ
jgi:outer membrane murein-binding lipoprotein Lpp